MRYPSFGGTVLLRFRVPAFAALFLCLSLPAAGIVATAGAETIRIGGTGGILQAVRLLGDAYRKSEPACPVRLFPSLGSGGGIKAAIAGNLEVGLSARPLTAEERGEGAVETAICRSAMVFVTSGKKPVPGITSAQLVEIYGGKLTRWPDGSPIRLVLRPEGDSDTVQLTAFSPAMKQAVKAALARPGMILALTDQEAADAIQKVPGTLGTSVLSLILAEKRPLKALPLDGVTPGPKAVADGSWPFVKTYYAVTGPSPSPCVRRFLEFLRSPAARRVLLQAGCLPAD
jgi:phosphate transport system substrate-binding protein